MDLTKLAIALIAGSMFVVGLILCLVKAGAIQSQDLETLTGKVDPKDNARRWQEANEAAAEEDAIATLKRLQEINDARLQWRD